MVRKDVIIGFVIGLISAVAGMIIFTLAIGLYKELSIKETMDQVFTTQFLGKRASIGALLNLPVFYYFLNKKKERRAMGVLLATIMIAIIFIVNRF